MLALLCPVSAMSVFGYISEAGPDTFFHRKVHIYKWQMADSDMVSTVGD